MIVTLYKNCILNDSYNEVLDVFNKTNGKSVRDNYLEKLPQTEIVLDDVYMTNQGQLIFDIEALTDILSFNYMKIFNNTEELYNNRYYFIDDLQIINGQAVISYTEDVWNTYAENMLMRESILSRTKFLKYQNGDNVREIPFYKLPLDFEGNNDLEIKSIGKAGNDKFLFCAKIQLYTTKEQGIASTRKTFTVFIRESQVLDVYMELGNIEQTLLQLVTYSSSGQLIGKGFEEGNKYFYDITEVFLVPAYLIGIELDETLDSALGVIKQSNKFDVTVFALFKSFYALNEPIGKLKEVKHFYLPPDFARLSVGTMETSIGIEESGNYIPIKVYMQCDYYDYGLYISLQNKFIEITNDFILDIPVQVVSADTVQQEKIDRNLRAIGTEFKIANGFGGLGENLVSGGSYLGKQRRLFTNKGEIKKQNFNNNLMASTGSSMIGSVGTIATGLAELNATYAPIFTTNKGMNTNSVALNLNYGLVEKLIVPDNRDEVVDYVNNEGYLCNEIVKGYVFDHKTLNMNESYNILKFDAVRLYGKFSQNVQHALTQIMLNGFKIWYKDNELQ